MVSCYKNTVWVNRDNNMGTLHLLAALFVMYGHHCVLLGMPIPTILGCEIQRLGLKIIFIISGYLITKSMWSINERRIKASIIYIIKRIGRVYPELIVCILFAALIIGPIFANMSWNEYWGNSPAIAQYIKFNLGMFPIFYLPGVFANNPYPNVVNGSLWTMPVEIVSYFLILIIFIVSKNDSVKKCVYGGATVAVVGAFLIRLTFFPNSSLVIHGTDWIQALNILPYFMVGGVTYVFDWKRYINLQKSSVLLLVFAASPVMSVSLIKEILCLIILSYFVLSLMLTSKQELALKRIHGEYSYGMYLYGFIVQQCVVQIAFLGRNVTFVSFHISFLICVILTYLLAMISYKCVYKTASRINKNIIDYVQRL